MNTRALAMLSASALMLGGTMVGCAAGVGHVAAASDAPALADKSAAKAETALARGKTDAAIGYAEAAVSADPQTPAMRVLLGQTYLKAGRFASAKQAFADALTLQPGNGKAALNLALMQTGLGDWAGARYTLDQHAAAIPAADRGLAQALAGDPAGATQLLLAVARSPGADTKTRQNLALVLALAGRWPEARAVASMDLSPADVDKRLEQWAAFARPRGAADQVSALLGVTPVADGGQPIALALAAPMAAAPAKVADAAPVSVPQPDAAATAAPTLALAPTVQFAAAKEVVQPLPAGDPIAPKAATVSAAAPARGDWYVQLGAYQSAAVARDGWTRIARRDAVIRSFSPTGMTFGARSGQVYRLSVGGFTRSAADGLCHRYRAKGGACFVRHGAGDQVAAWLKKKSVQMASL